MLNFKVTGTDGKEYTVAVSPDKVNSFLRDLELAGVYFNEVLSLEASALENSNINALDKDSYRVYTDNC